LLALFSHPFRNIVLFIFWLFLNVNFFSVTYNFYKYLISPSPLPELSYQIKIYNSYGITLHLNKYILIITGNVGLIPENKKEGRLSPSFLFSNMYY